VSNYPASHERGSVSDISEVMPRLGRQTIKYDRLRKTRRTVYVLACVTTWLVYLHGGKLVLLPKVTVDVDNIKLDNDVMTIR